MNIRGSVGIEGAASTGAVTTTDGIDGGTALKVGGKSSAAVADSAAVTGAGPTAYATIDTIPANTLIAGKTVRVRGCVRSTGLNAADTKTITVLVGATIYLTSTAASAASGDRCVFELLLTARAAPGAAASVQGHGFSAWSTAANAPAYGGNVANQATNAALVVGAKVANSSASAGNTSVIESLVVDYV